MTGNVKRGYGRSWPRAVYDWNGVGKELGFCRSR